MRAMVNLKQFFGIGRYVFNLKHAYRFDSFIWMSIIPMFFIVEFFMWKAIFAVSGQEVIKGFTFNQIALYYLMSHIVMASTTTNADKKIAHLIRSGKLIRYLVKPIHYIVFSFCRHIWKNILHFIKYVPLLLIAGYILIPSVDFASLQPVFFLISVIFASLLMFAYVFSFGLISFWMKDYEGMYYFRKGFAGFFTGMLIPLTFFPLIFQKAFFYLPFQYMLYVPLQIFLGTYEFNQMIVLIGMQAIWSVIFLGISLAIWKKASSKFMGVGV